MILSVWLPLLLPLLVVPLAAIGAVRALPDRLHPRAAVWALTATAVGLAAAGCAALGLLAGSALLHLPWIAALGHISLPLVDAMAPEAVVPIGAAAGLLLAGVLASGLRTLRRQLRELAAARRLAERHGSHGDLVVLPDSAPDAYALPGAPGRVVISDGMLRALAPAEREVLLAHERAHLACRHHLFLSLAELAAAVHPLLRPLRDAVRYSVERWADECAAAAVRDRRLTARAIGRAALAGSRAPARAGRRGRPAVVPAAASGSVPRRVGALLGGDAARAAGVAPRRRGALIAMLLAAVLTTSLGATLDAAHDLHHQVEVAQAESHLPRS
ncbi:M56 family metallopeptidase [Phaeacidiphilus oryzae]|uniref:M56 family metallopeptidase n=1 Tax=Phaeacidiphilus oryzae TaxID=348818 RepID=UPI000566D4EF|nr:M56 family metallopeptidase [Phaeacidiphilus oryzae]